MNEREWRECHSNPPSHDKEEGYAFPVMPEDEFCGNHQFTKKLELEMTEKVDREVREGLAVSGQLVPEDANLLQMLPPAVIRERMGAVMEDMGLKQVCGTCIWWLKEEKDSV